MNSSEIAAKVYLYTDSLRNVHIYSTKDSCENHFIFILLFQVQEHLRGMNALKIRKTST